MRARKSKPLSVPREERRTAAYAPPADAQQQFSIEAIYAYILDPEVARRIAQAHNPQQLKQQLGKNSLRAFMPEEIWPAPQATTEIHSLPPTPEEA